MNYIGEMLIMESVMALLESITFFMCREVAAWEHICSLCYSQSSSQTSAFLFLHKTHSVSDKVTCASIHTLQWIHKASELTLARCWACSDCLTSDSNCRQNDRQTFDSLEKKVFFLPYTMDETTRFWKCMFRNT